ncbi:MAG: hypothetical protein WB646_11070 [Steroidobacteraceae bacterium]
MDEADMRKVVRHLVNEIGRAAPLYMRAGHVFLTQLARADPHKLIGAGAIVIRAVAQFGAAQRIATTLALEGLWVLRLTSSAFPKAKYSAASSRGEHLSEAAAARIAATSSPVNWNVLRFARLQ